MAVQMHQYVYLLQIDHQIIRFQLDMLVDLCHFNRIDIREIQIDNCSGR